MGHHRTSRRATIVRERTLARRTVTADIELSRGGTTIDLGDRPYTVPCPVCGAPACSLCRRVIEGAHRPTMLVVPHPEREEEWIECPEKRVVPVR